MKLLLSSLVRGFRLLVSRRIYLVCLVAVPILFTLFFINMMDQGLPRRAPVALVDMDQSQLSRRVGCHIAANELSEITETPESFHKAMELVRQGRVYGFFVIPDNFQRDALAGKKPTLSYYTNLTYFVPGSLVFKGFSTVAVTTAGGLVEAKLTDAGLPEGTVGDLIQPVSIQQICPGNPWMNYNYYLTDSFVPGIVELMVMLITSFSVCELIKRHQSRRWLGDSGGSIVVGLTGRLAPQALVATLVGVACQAIMYGFNHFPMHCAPWHMWLAMLMMVLASQGFALTMCCLIPNLRLSMSLCALTGILAFSLAAFSYPVQQMYPAVGIFSYILPVRYYFLIYVDQALNGLPLYYSRYFYMALLAFVVLPLAGLWRLKRHMLNPVYVP